MLISVIIPHYQDLANLDLCLNLLKAQTLDSSAFEIIVADNMSPVGVAEVEKVINGRAKLVISEVKGAGATRNVGVAAATGDILAFTDSDCRPDPSYLEAGVKALQQYDMVGGEVRVEVVVPGDPTPSEAFELVFAFQNKKYITKKRFTVTATLFVTKAIFDAVGPFRNDVSEDMEWCHRAGGMGYRLGYAPEAVVGHPARHQWPELARKWRRLTNESFLLFRSKKSAVAWLAYNWFVLLATLPQSLAIFKSDRLSTLGQRLAALAILVRLRLLRFIWAHQAVFSARKHG